MPMGLGVAPLRRCPRGPGLLVGSLMLVLAAPATAGDCRPLLVIGRADATGTVLRSMPLPRARFALGFVHSVTLTPVLDEYRVVGTDIVQTAQHFQAHGPGMTADLSEVGDATNWMRDATGIRIEMTRPIADLVLRVDPDYGNHLAIDDLTLDLTGWGRARLRLVVVHPPGPCETD